MRLATTWPFLFGVLQSLGLIIFSRRMSQKRKFQSRGDSPVKGKKRVKGIEIVHWGGTINIDTSIPQHQLLSTLPARVLYTACVNEWRERILTAECTSELGMYSSRSHPVLVSAAGECSVLAEHFLALMYRPSKSVHSNNSLDIATMRRIILPQLENKSVYIEEMLMIGVCNNEDVDLRAVSLIAANPKHWICINFCRRLQAICDIRRICGQNQVAWGGGPDVCQALTGLSRNWHVSDLKSNNIDTGPMGEVLVRADQHPSTPLMHGMDVSFSRVTRMELALFRAVFSTVKANLVLTEIKVKSRMTLDEQPHRQQCSANVLWMETISTRSVMQYFKSSRKYHQCFTTPSYQN